MPPFRSRPRPSARSGPKRDSPTPGRRKSSRTSSSRDVSRRPRPENHTTRSFSSSRERSGESTPPRSASYFQLQKRLRSATKHPFLWPRYHLPHRRFQMTRWTTPNQMKKARQNLLETFSPSTSIPSSPSSTSTLALIQRRQPRSIYPTLPL